MKSLACKIFFIHRLKRLNEGKILIYIAYPTPTPPPKSPPPLTLAQHYSNLVQRTRIRGPLPAPEPEEGKPQAGSQTSKISLFITKMVYVIPPHPSPELAACFALQYVGCSRKRRGEALARSQTWILQVMSSTEILRSLQQRRPPLAAPN